MRTALATAAMVCALVSPGTAQRELDRGTLLISHGGRLVGQEDFVLRRGRGSGAPDGFSVSSTALYPPDYPERRLVAVIEFGADAEPAASRHEVLDGERRRVLLRLDPRRLTVRNISPTGESAREYPGAARYVLLDDSLFAYHAVLRSAPAGAAEVVWLDGRRGGRVSVTDDGFETVDLAGTPLRLRRLTLTTSGETRQVWYDDAGRLMKVTIPRRRVSVERARPGRP